MLINPDTCRKGKISKHTISLQLNKITVAVRNRTEKGRFIIALNLSCPTRIRYTVRGNRETSIYSSFQDGLDLF